jgi:phenylpropionate dioxygenase-like ring-hydroxylating dioxygenase large terminal subunit
MPLFDLQICLISKSVDIFSVLCAPLVLLLVLQGEIEFECGHWGVFENAIDMAHIHYLHGDSFGNSEQPRIHDMSTTRDTFHVEAQFR